MDGSSPKSPYKKLEQRARELERDCLRLRKRNNALEKINEKYQTALESRTDLVCRFLSDGTLTFVNNTIARQLGKHPEQMMWENMYHYIPVGIRNMVRKRLSILSPENPVVEITYRILNRNNEAIWLHWINIAFFDEKGEVAEIQATGRDVTKLKRTLESLNLSEQRFRHFIETMNDGFFQLDKNFVIVYANLRLCEILGYEREKVIGRSVVTFFDKKNKDIFLKQFEKRKKGGNVPYRITWKKKSGGHLRVLVSPTSLLDEEGVFEGSYSVIRGIVGSKQIKNDLKDLLKPLNNEKIEVPKTDEELEALTRIRDEGLWEISEGVSNLEQALRRYLKKLSREASKKENAYNKNIWPERRDRISSEFAKYLTSRRIALTYRELQVATLVKDGKSSKEIAGLLNVSQKTVDFHRLNIRKKFGINNKRVNLQAQLVSLNF